MDLTPAWFFSTKTIDEATERVREYLSEKPAQSDESVVLSRADDNEPINWEQ